MNDTITVQVAPGLSEIAAADWDRCAADGGDAVGNPFLSHAFLSALEDSGSVGGRLAMRVHKIQ